MSRSFGHAPFASVRVAREDLTTSEGLIRSSLENGWLDTAARASDAARRTGKRLDLTVVEAPDGTRYVRLTKDEPRDPRTQRQKDADREVRAMLRDENEKARQRRAAESQEGDHADEDQ